jgi:hypothetical protein
MKFQFLRPLDDAQGLEPLGQTDRRTLEKRIPDIPSTVIPSHIIRNGLGRVYCVGPPKEFAAAIVQDPFAPNEPIALGSDPKAMWSLLSRIPGWDSVALPQVFAERMAAILEGELGTRARCYGDLYYALNSPPVAFCHPAVRRLGLQDAALVGRSEGTVQGGGYETIEQMLVEGRSAAGVVGERIVSMAFVSAHSTLFADIGISTLQPWRNLGMASAAVYLVAQAVQAMGKTPIWSTGEDNFASQRVAMKIGFEPLNREGYVLVPALQKSGGFIPRNSK